MIVQTLALIALSSPAFAAPRADLTSSITRSTTPYVYQSARYTVAVRNSGNATASGSSVVIQLPVTHGSTVVVLGTLGAKSASCTQSGTRLTCTLGSISRGATSSVYFDIAFPESTSALVLTSAPTTTSSESSTTNNGASYTAALNNYTVSFTAPHGFTNSHCTGTGLTSYFECTSGSLSSHDTTFNADGSLTIDEAPGYTGTWSQPTSDSLTFEYYDETGALVAEFEGYGTTTSCWEGITTFDTSTWMSPYKVCAK